MFVSAWLIWLASAGPIGALLPGIHGRARHQQGGEVHLVAIHAGEQGTLERISTVSAFHVLSCHVDLTAGSLTQATDTSNIRLVFAAVKETILQNALKDSGIL